jgi:hypothetical protein
MFLDSCPTSDQLREFLDDELNPPLQEAVGTHVDTCKSCQTRLEELTQPEAYDLRALGTEWLTGSPDRGDQAQNETQEPEGTGRDAEGPSRAGNDGEAACPSERERAPGHNNTKSYISASTTAAGPKSTDPDECDRPLADTAILRTEPRSHKPQLLSYELLDLLGEGGMSDVARPNRRLASPNA